MGPLILSFVSPNACCWSLLCSECSWIVLHGPLIRGLLLSLHPRLARPLLNTLCLQPPAGFQSVDDRLVSSRISQMWNETHLSFKISVISSSWNEYEFTFLQNNLHSKLDCSLSIGTVSQTLLPKMGWQGGDIIGVSIGVAFHSDPRPFPWDGSPDFLLDGT